MSSSPYRPANPISTVIKFICLCSVNEAAQGYTSVIRIKLFVSVSVSMWSQGDWRGNDLLTYYIIKMFRSALLNYHQTSFLLRLPLKWGRTLFLSHRGTPAFSPTFRSVCALWKAQQGFYGFCCSNLHWVTMKHSAEKLPDDRQTDR